MADPSRSEISTIANRSGVVFGSTRSIERTPVHFLHVRKTGGTAIIEALRPVASQYALILHDHATKLRDVPADHRVVFFVRHPISRFVSGFYSRLRCGLPRHHYPWNAAELEAFRHFRTPNGLAEALSASNEQVRVRAIEAMRGISHVKNTYKEWFSGTRELDERLSSILLLGIQEELSADFEHLKKVLQLPEAVSLPSDDTFAHRTPPEFDRYLTPLAERNLAQWYADDVQFYEHCLRIRTANRIQLNP
jgi:hypothetical protein